ncbi:hypothetical protein [Methylobacterium oryzihabitans]|uniref:Uncharacterized protein n=1 Tax=Methylobacterium oryzihabitans TaxID=2499852 RepID=A0A437PD14_9HYPH|nr:hypothetical protein [Methylobacterium oryzihabitans]RVU20157.1 hypothetical protein EOE48_05985 [Methylobacterium oryzihabitans]
MPDVRHAAPTADPVSPPAAGCPVETIAASYLVLASGDPGLALRCAITDALADLMEAERRTRRNSRLISRGYVRGALDAAGSPAGGPFPAGGS